MQEKKKVTSRKRTLTQPADIAQTAFLGVRLPVEVIQKLDSQARRRGEKSANRLAARLIEEGLLFVSRFSDLNLT